MTEDRRITLFHAPMSRSSGVLCLLEELGATYDLTVLDLQAGDSRRPEFLSVNPMGKVPTILHNGAVITEQVAIYLYLADLYPEAGLAPAIGDPLRGPYLRWMAFMGASFEPAIIDRAASRDPGMAKMSPYGNFDTALGTVVSHLSKGDFLLGSRFCAADVLWGSGLNWTLSVGLVPDLPVIRAYANRVGARPAIIRARAKDAELAATQ